MSQAKNLQRKSVRRVAMRVGCSTYINTLMMYACLLHRLIATVIVRGLLLQGCGPGSQISGASVLKNARRTSHDEQALNQLSCASPCVRWWVVSSCISKRAVFVGHFRGLSRFAYASSCRQSRYGFLQPSWSMASEEVDTRPAAQVVAYSSVGCLVSSRAWLCAFPTPVLGAQAWRRYFGEVCAVLPLPLDTGEILDFKMCEFVAPHAYLM
jgi:hypothetical protein